MTVPGFARTAKDVAFIGLGILSAGFGLKGFLVSSHFIDGGVTGISMLMGTVARFPLWLTIPILNLPFVAFGYRVIGRTFALKSTIAMAGLAICLGLVPYPNVTSDSLLTALFGGAFIGAGIGLAMRGGAVLDGTDIAALVISRRSALLKVSDVILVFNVAIFGAAMFVLGTDRALYSILTYVAASKTVELIVFGIEQYTAVMVVSERAEEIRRVVIDQLGRGLTILRGKRGFTKQGDRDTEIDVVFTVVTRLELPRLRGEIRRIDPNAFITQHAIDDAVGGLLKRRALH